MCAKLHVNPKGSITGVAVQWTLAGQRLKRVGTFK